MASRRAEALKAERARQKRQETLDSIEQRLTRIENALESVLRNLEQLPRDGFIENGGSGLLEPVKDAGLPVIFDTVTLNQMKRPELEDAAERLGLEDIEGTGADGNVLVDDLRDALRPYATDIVAKAE